MNLVILSKDAHPHCFSALIDTLLKEPEKNEELLLQIMIRIQLILGKNGHPGMPYGRILHNVQGEMYELRADYNSNELLRIYYYVDKTQNKMLLLNYIIKPAQYQKALQRKVEKEIDDSISLALKLKNTYPVNHHLYGSFPRS